jgi:RNA polymerase sigma-70 factor (sigma-E family)
MEDTFSEYVIARGPALLRFGFVLCGDRHLAEDLVQEVLARAHRQWRRVEAATSPDAYVRKAIVREFLSWRRRLTNRELVIGDLPEPTHRDDGRDPQTGITDRDEMWWLLAQLSRMQRAVLVLRFYEDMSNEQIAELLGCAAGTVRMHASRGLAHLRITMTSDLDNVQLGGKA